MGLIQGTPGARASGLAKPGAAGPRPLRDLALAHRSGANAVSMTSDVSTMAARKAARWQSPRSPADVRWAAGGCRSAIAHTEIHSAPHLERVLTLNLARSRRSADQ